MKILLLANARTGSKLVQQNITSYLNAQGPVNTFMPILGKRLVYTNSFEMVDDPEITDHYQNVPSLIAASSKVNTHVSAKFHPKYGINDIELELASYFDKVVILRRYDLFEQSLSRLVSNKLHEWTYSEGQQSKVKAIISNPMQIDLGEWRELVRNTIMVHNCTIQTAISVSFETVINVKTDREFCDLLDLPFVSFPFKTEVVEYGSSKNLMVRNIKELKIAFDEEMEKHLRENQ